MDSSEGFDDHVALITGGSKGIGRGIAEGFLAAGAKVVVCARNAPDTLPAANGRVAEFMPCDVREAEAVKALIAAIVERHGRLDVLVNNAGGTPMVDAATASPRFHEGVIRLNLLAALHAAQAANAEMQQQAVECAQKVRVVAVSPGLIRTEQPNMHYGDAAGIAAVGATIPAGRMGEPADVAQACLFLASPRAAYISGTNLLLHGGGEKPAFLAAATAKEKHGG